MTFSHTSTEGERVKSSSCSNFPDCHIPPVIENHPLSTFVVYPGCGRCSDDAEEEEAIESWEAMVEGILSDRGVP